MSEWTQADRALLASLEKTSKEIKELLEKALKDAKRTK